MKTSTNTPKSNKNTPMSKKGQQKTPKGNKKQKLDENKIKEINTNSSNKQNKTAKSNFKKASSTEGSRIRVAFPRWKGVNFDEIQKIFEGCNNVFFTSVLIQCDQSVESQKLEELKKIKIQGIPLKVFEHSSKIVSNKRIIFLLNEKEVEAAKKLFKAKSIEKLVNRAGKHAGRKYVLTFETEKEAETASKKKLQLDDNIRELEPYYDFARENKSTTPGEKKSSEAERKQKQQKRKADEDDEESDEEDEDENGDNTTEGIEMDDDDDDEEEEEEDDDDE